MNFSLDIIYGYDQILYVHAFCSEVMVGLDPQG